MSMNWPEPDEDDQPPRATGPIAWLTGLGPSGFMLLGAVLFVIGMVLNVTLGSVYGSIVVLAAVACFGASIAGNARRNQGPR